MGCVEHWGVLSDVKGAGIHAGAQVLLGAHGLSATTDSSWMHSNTLAVPFFQTLCCWMLQWMHAGCPPERQSIRMFPEFFKILPLGWKHQKLEFLDSAHRQNIHMQELLRKMVSAQVGLLHLDSSFFLCGSQLTPSIVSRAGLQWCPRKKLLSLD